MVFGGRSCADWWLVGLLSLVRFVCVLWVLIDRGLLVLRWVAVILVLVFVYVGLVGADFGCAVYGVCFAWWGCLVV